MRRLLGTATCLKLKNRGVPLSDKLAQEHNRLTCHRVYHNVSFVLSAKQESCEYHFYSLLV